MEYFRGQSTNNLDKCINITLVPNILPTIQIINKGGSVRPVIPIILSTMLAAGCSSDPMKIAEPSKAGREVLGHAQGSACGSLLLGWPVYSFIPAGINSRVERAYERALNSVPGATGLTNITIEDSWAWWLLGISRCFTVEGEAIG